MSYARLIRIDKPFFSQHEVAQALGTKLSSAQVLCSRYVSKGLLARLKRGYYARIETLIRLGQMDLFRIANFLQVPSYVSLRTALAFYGIVPRVQGDFLESISVKRTKTFRAGRFLFHYTKIRPDLYTGFAKDDGVFIALPEKAVLDSLYLASMGRYAFDVSSLDFTNVDEAILAEFSAIYPPRTRRYLDRYYASVERT